MAANRAAAVESTLHDFMRKHNLIRRSTRHTTNIDLKKTLTMMSGLKEKLSKTRGKEDELGQVLKEKEIHLKGAEFKLAEAEGKKRTLGRNVEYREKELTDFESRFSEASSKISEAGSRIRILERQLERR